MIGAVVIWLLAFVANCGDQVGHQHVSSGRWIGAAHHRCQGNTYRGQVQSININREYLPWPAWQVQPLNGPKSQNILYHYHLASWLLCLLDKSVNWWSSIQTIKLSEHESIIKGSHGHPIGLALEGITYSCSVVLDYLPSNECPCQRRVGNIWANADRVSQILILHILASMICYYFHFQTKKQFGEMLRQSRLA